MTLPKLNQISLMLTKSQTASPKGSSYVQI